MQTYRIALLALLSTLLLYSCTKSDDDNTPQQTTYTVNNLNGERMFYGYAITTELDSSVIDSVGVNNYLITINVVNDSTLKIYNLSTYTTGATLKRTTKPINSETRASSHLTGTTLSKRAKMGYYTEGCILTKTITNATIMST